MANRRKLTIRRTSMFVALVVAIPIVLLVTLSLSAPKPDYLGVRQRQLAACPSTPNCVSSQAMDESHQIEPIAFSGTPAAAMQAIKSALAKLPRTRIVTCTDDYLHAEATSLVFRFVDDVEFFVDADNGLIHFRSASRAGYSDLGKNRSRMEKFRVAFEQQVKNSIP